MEMETDPFLKAWYGQTVLHPIGLAAIVLLGTALLLLPRRYATMPALVAACFIAPAQRVALFTLNFDLLRILVLFGSARVFLRGEWRGFRGNRLDSILLAWAFCGTIIYILQQGTFDAVKYKLGALYDVLGMYLLFRCLIQNWADIHVIIRGLGIISIPVLLAFVAEHVTGRNVFAILGGVPEVTLERDGRLRCQGAFAHPILAGCFWAAVIPLMAAECWRGPKARRAAVCAVAASCLIIVLCASSTPVAALAFCLVGAMAFLVRFHLAWVRWSLVVVLVILHMVMAKPVWHLVGRLDFAGGSTGYHRYLLIDAAIGHFREWWLLGVASTAAWGDGLEDVTNQYILEGVRGGLLTMVLFLGVVATAFQQAGKLWRAHQNDRARLVLAWAFGVCIFVHAMNFVGVSYFGQINVLWYLELAAIASLINADHSLQMRHVSGLHALADLLPYHSRWQRASHVAAFTRCEMDSGRNE